MYKLSLSHQPNPRGFERTWLTKGRLQISEADKQAGRAKSNIEAYAKDAKAETLKGIDKFDQKVEEGSAKAKGWFGGSK